MASKPESISNSTPLQHPIPPYLKWKKPYTHLYCLICGPFDEKAYLYRSLDGKSLKALIFKNGEFVEKLGTSRIKGGQDHQMSSDDILQMITSVSQHVLFASYKPQKSAKGELLLSPKPPEGTFIEHFSQSFIEPPLQNLQFIGRNTHLEKITQTFATTNKVALVPEEGIHCKTGKTEIAKAYAHQTKYEHTLWLRAENPWFIEQGFKEFASKIGIELTQLPQWFSEHPDCLVVLDGYVKDSQEIIDRYLEKTTCRVLFTTRETELKNIEKIPVGVFAEEESTEYLLHITGQTDNTTASDIARMLGGVAVSLQKAALFILRNSIELSAYIFQITARLKVQEQRLRKEFNLPKHNENFVGREIDLVTLEETLAKEKPLVLAAEVGLGGIGKTQIALQYAYRKAEDYSLIWWVNCENKASLSDSYSQLAEKLGIVLTDEEKKQENALIHKVNMALKHRPGWLLVFDDTQNKESIEGLLPESGGHVIITSRNANWGSLANVFKVGVFKRSESIDLIMKITGLYSQKEDADRLADLLKDLPLAISQAAHYIEATKITIAEYIKLFETKHKILWDHEKPVDEYKFTVRVAWDISMEAILREDIERSKRTTFPTLAGPLMNLCSFFAPSNIQVGFFLETWIAQNHGSENAKHFLGQPLELLSRYSMIDVDNERGSVSIHPIVQTVTRDHMEKEDTGLILAQMTQEAFGLFNELAGNFDSDKVETWEDGKVWLQHVLSFLSHAQVDELDKEKLADVYFYIGKVKDFSIEFKEALEFFQKALTIRLAKLGNEHPDVASTYGNMALVYDDQGLHDKALEFYQKALDIDLSKLGTDHPDVAAIYNNMGAVYDDQGLHDKALEFYQKALDIRLAKLGPDHPSVATTYNNMGSVYYSQDLNDKALESFQKALDILLAKLGPDHPYVATTYNNIALVYDDQGLYDKALTFYQKALTIRLAKLGNNHPDVAQTYNNMGEVYNAQGQYEKALEFYQKALTILRKFFKDDHPHIQSVLSNIKQLQKDNDKKCTLQ
ncbi:MAG: Photosystem I assembly protein Ycf3 [Chlamydiae bacterium]|nr:Photosystem I assembly protein Ycf3 [Chlamydiota bacterium]